MKPKVCFIANNRKTDFFLKISKYIVADGGFVCWISPAKRTTRWLIDNGVDSHNILDLTNAKDRLVVDYAQLDEIEKLSGMYLSQIARMDRKFRSSANALPELASIASSARKFLLDKKIEYCFGEQTWAYELVVGMICRSQKIRCFKPHTIRIPDGRFGFFPFPFESTLQKLDGNEDNIDFIDFKKKFVKEKPKPKYAILNDKVISGSYGSLQGLLRNIKYDLFGGKDYSRVNSMYIAHEKLARIKHKILSTAVNLFDDVSNSVQPYVLYTLHKQPEASVDVLGYHKTNQFEVIVDISNRLPVGTLLYVKEHSNALGDRGLGFYKSVKKINNVRLISPYVNSFDLVKESECVVSISGTVCYEAKFIGRPSFTFADMFFDKGFNFNFDFNKCMDSFSDFSSDFEYIYMNSCKGYVSDPLSDPDCMTDKNIFDVYNGFCRLFNYYA